MPVVNIGYARTRDLIGGFHTEAVDSLGFGTDSTAEAATDTRLGDNAGTSYWKTGGNVTITRSEATPNPNQADPWVQYEASFAETDITPGANDEVALYELGTAFGVGVHADQNDQKLYTRARIGGAGGIGKTQEVQLIGRVKITY